MSARTLRLFVLARALCLPIALLAGDTTTSRPIAPGVVYTAIQRLPELYEIRVLRIDRNAPHIGLDTRVGKGVLKGLERTSAMVGRAQRPGTTVVAAVNADFYTMRGGRAGRPLGPVVRAGEVVGTGQRKLSFYITADGAPHIGELSVRGELRTPYGRAPIGGVNADPAKDSVALYTSSWGWEHAGAAIVAGVAGLPLRSQGAWRGLVQDVLPPDAKQSILPGQVLIAATGSAEDALRSAKPGDRIAIELQAVGLEQPVTMAAGGGPLLLQQGRIIPEDNPKAPRHPRTAVGFSQDAIVFVTVDGRQAGWSRGMRLYTLATLLQELGCQEALNLDGGGSTTCWVRETIVNRPSDGHERWVSNAIAITSDAPRGPLARLTVRPERITTFGEQAVPLTVWLTDASYNPVKADASLIETVLGEVPGAGTQIRTRYADGQLHLSGGPGQTTVRLRHPAAEPARAEVRVSLVTRCIGLQITPPTAALCAGENAEFTVTGTTEDGATVRIPQHVVRWECTDDGAATETAGRYQATTAGATVRITAAAGGAEATAVLRVAEETELEGFEDGTPPPCTTFPAQESVSAKVSIAEPDAMTGTRYARLVYDLGRPDGTRASYLRLDRAIGAALSVSFGARARGPNEPWIRVALIDANGTRHTLTAAETLPCAQDWARLDVRLPSGLKRPITWESVYVVATGGRKGEGTLDVDDLRVARLEED